MSEMDKDTAARIEPIRFGRAICGRLAEAERREWWISNGLGGYSAGTIAGTLTRRYHGALIAAVDPPLGRRLVLAKVDATLEDGSNSYPLFANRWADGQIVPAGHLGLESFHLDYAIPVWTYAVGGWRIEARIWMEQGEETTYLAWLLHPNPGNATAPSLNLTLLANNRDHHSDTSEDAFQPTLSVTGDTLRVADGTRFVLAIRAPGGRITSQRTWWRNFDLPIEVARGLNSSDAHLCVGQVTLPLRPGEWCGVVATLAADPTDNLAAALERRIARERQVVSTAVPVPPWISRLRLAADGFLFKRPVPGDPEGRSVIAGYPWFGDWGRDTMISLPGLTLAVGRPEIALRILRTFGQYVSQGMLPNLFPGAGETPEYNTADAALWFFEAWRAYVEATGDVASLREVYPVLVEMVGWHRRGTRFGIVVDQTDGLLRAGQAGVQVTWMDAKVGDVVVTPRIGKPVEINALWYNALCVMSDFAKRLGETDDFAAPAAAARAGFARFSRADGQGLYDVIDGPDGNDDRIRPNQIFAVSLPHSPLATPEQARVVDVCRRHLFTSYGLRSLAPGAAEYHPFYVGGVSERDGSYHQGPVWGWLLGHYALAVFRVTGDAAAAQALLEPMRDALTDQGLGTIGEIFDGDAPHEPRGAPAQAWSVACTLQAWYTLEALRNTRRATA